MTTDNIDKLFDKFQLNLAGYLDREVYLPVKEELKGGRPHSLGIKKEMFKHYVEEQTELLKDETKKIINEDNRQWIFRFNDKVPVGRFEYLCGICGNYEIVSIPESIELDKPLMFSCKCGATLYIWKQPTHWHLKIVKS